MDVMDKKYDVFFRRTNKERYWRVEKKVSLYGLRDLLENMLEKTTERIIEIRIIKR